MHVLIVEDKKNIDKLIDFLNDYKEIDLIFVTKDAITTSDEVTRIDIDSDEILELAEFAEANLIDYTITFSYNAQINEIFDVFNARQLKIFGTNYNTFQYLFDRNNIKKFFNKNKIPSSRYGIFEKDTQAFEYLKQLNYPIFIKVNEKNEKESVVLCHSLKQARSEVIKFFIEEHKRIFIEEKIEGHSFSLYYISDSYTTISLLDCAIIDDLVITPDFKITEDDKAYLTENYINKFFTALKNKNLNTTGIFRFDFIFDKGDFYLINVDSQIRQIDFQALLFTIKTNIFDILRASIEGYLEDYINKIEYNSEFFALTKSERKNIPDEVIKIIEDENILISKGNTLNNAINFLKEGIFCE